MENLAEKIQEEKNGKFAPDEAGSDERKGKAKAEEKCDNAYNDTIHCLSKKVRAKKTDSSDAKKTRKCKDAKTERGEAEAKR